MWTGGRIALTAAALAVGYGVLLTVAYVAADLPGSTGTMWWIPAGLGLGVLTLAPRHAWPALTVSIIAVSLLLGALGIPPQRTLPLGPNLAWSTANGLSVWASAEVVRRWGEHPFDLRSARNVIVLVAPATAAAAFVNAAGAFVGWTLWPGPRPEFAAWVSLSSVALGQISIAPLVLAIAGERGAWSHGRTGEALLLCGALALTAWATFELPSAGAQIIALASATFPLLAWAALRFGPRGAAAASFLLTAFGIWRTRLGEGPFGHGADPVERLSYVGVFFGLASASSLLLAAVACERRRSQRATVALQHEVSAQARRNAETLALLGAVLRSAPVGIAILDRDLRLVQANDALARIDGLSSGAHLGRTPRELFPEVAPLVEAQLARVLASGEPVVGYRIDGWNAEHPGQQAIWECTWFPVRTDDGAIIGICAIVADETDRIVAEREREQALQEAREAIRLRDDFLSVASHELKTPLTPLAARLAMMEKQAAAGEAIPLEMIARTRASLRKLVALVDELLDVTHIRQVSARNGFERCALHEIVAEAGARFRDRSRRHQLQIELPPDPIEAQCDRTGLSRVLANLIDNAYKYSPEGGRVRLRLAAEGEDAVISVSDEGIGIPRSEQGLLFTRFARATNAPSRSYGGLGLGLYASREIVERHGGRIAVESEEGRGSTFTVRIPRAHAHATLETLH